MSCGLRQYCPECDEFTESWVDSSATTRCLQCDGPDRQEDEDW
jgi:hypothetical protein